MYILYYIYIYIYISYRPPPPVPHFCFTVKKVEGGREGGSQRVRGFDDGQSESEKESERERQRERESAR